MTKKLKFVGSSRSSVALVYKSAIDYDKGIPVREGTHKYWLVMAVAEFDEAEETFTLRELGVKAEELGLVVKKEGAKTDGPYLASYYKKFLVEAGMIALVKDEEA